MFAVLKQCSDAVAVDDRSLCVCFVTIHDCRDDSNNMEGRRHQG